MQLANKTNCTGCATCVMTCPQKCLCLEKDEFGFAYPVIGDPQKCIECKKCEKSCPVITEINRKDYDLHAYSAYAKDETVRMESSSGGIFTLLAKEILKRDGIVFGAAYCEDFYVKHIGIEKESDISRLRGAKYVQSDLSFSFISVKENLMKGTPVLFSGTPCQVSGLKSFLGKEYKNLITVDFVCHGVPSPLAWEQYVKYRSVLDNDGMLPESINLRSKITGWSRYSYSNVYCYERNKCYSVINSNDLFMRLFVGDYINRLSCADCRFKGYERVSDITLGDFWGIWDIFPGMDDNKGTSLILTHSETGNKLFTDISDNIVIQEVTLQQASQQNPSLLTSSLPKPEREELLKLCCKGEFEEITEYFKAIDKSRKPSLSSRIFNKLRRLV